MREHGSGLRCKQMHSFYLDRWKLKLVKDAAEGSKIRSSIYTDVLQKHYTQSTQAVYLQAYVYQFRHFTWSYEFGEFVSPLTRNAGYRIESSQPRDCMAASKKPLENLAFLSFGSYREVSWLSLQERACGRHSHEKKTYGLPLNLGVDSASCLYYNFQPVQRVSVDRVFFFSNNT